MTTPEEMEKLMDLFGELGARPKADTPEELCAWMKEFVATKDKDTANDNPEDRKVKIETSELTRRRGAWSHDERQMRLSVTFSGDEAAKGDSKYDLWRYEVECLIKEGTHTEEGLRHMIRRSLKGDAAHVLKRMHKHGNPSIAQILDKFDTVYGIVETAEETLAEFYSARQKQQEDVSAWGCRLEELLDRAARAGVIHDRDIDEMLRRRFWSGLQPRLKEASRHNFDTIRDFDRLRVVVRAIDHEFKQEEELPTSQPKEPKKTAKRATVKDDDDAKEDKDLKGILCKLANTVETLQKQMTAMQEERMQTVQKMKAEKKPEATPTAEKKPFACFKCGDPGHGKTECPQLPECYKCHKRGHVQKYCHLNRK